MINNQQYTIYNLPEVGCALRGVDAGCDRDMDGETDGWLCYLSSAGSEADKHMWIDRWMGI
jgi:hypothetical protein